MGLFSFYPTILLIFHFEQQFRSHAQITFAALSLLFLMSFRPRQGQERQAPDAQQPSLAPDKIQKLLHGRTE